MEIIVQHSQRKSDCMAYTTHPRAKRGLRVIAYHTSLYSRIFSARETTLEPRVNIGKGTKIGSLGEILECNY